AELSHYSSSPRLFGGKSRVQDRVMPGELFEHLDLRTCLATDNQIALTAAQSGCLDKATDQRAGPIAERRAVHAERHKRLLERCRAEELFQSGRGDIARDSGRLVAWGEARVGAVQESA